MFILKPPVEFPSAMYIPVTSIVTANLPRSSALMALSCSCTEASSGASSVKAKPRVSNRSVKAIPTSKLTIREASPSLPTFARIRSVALMFISGFIMFPVQFKKLPFWMWNVLSGMIGISYFSSPLITE